MSDITVLLRRIGIKQTKQRIAVLSELQKGKRPLSAEEIYRLAADRDISLSTVYRTLEMFSEKGIVEKSVIHDSDKYFYELISEGHRHYAICLACNDMKYVDVCPLHDVPVSIGDFTVTAHKLELYGYCEKCREKQ